MSEDRLRTLLREEPLSGAAEAESRGLAMVERAYAERRRAERPVLPRLAVALAAITLLAALLLSPAGAAVRDWIDDVFTAGVRNAEPTLTEIPAGGELLVGSPRGPWVVQGDGSRRLLGSYREATWSPHGLFVAVAAGRTLSALEPDGTPRWSISANGLVADPRWSPSGFRIAYRADESLRVVKADGDKDALLAPASAPVPPAWLPSGPHVLAYLDGNRRIVVTETDTGTRLDTAKAAPGTLGLDWSRDGGGLLEITRHTVQVREVELGKVVGLRLGATRPIPLPSAATVRDAAFSPRGDAIAVLLERPAENGVPRSEAILVDPAGGPGRRLFAVSGRLTELAWSPDAGRLLLAWPAADQWLFVPTEPGPRLRAIGDVSAVFAPGQIGRAPFPRVEGWCCAATVGSD